MTENEELENRLVGLERAQRQILERYEVLSEAVKRVERKVAELEHRVGEVKVKIDYIEAEAP